jgi:phage baseplate assembly protein W
MSQDESFLGVGWSFPPTFSAGGENVNLVANEVDIHQSLEIIFTTELGERLLHPHFGSEFKQFLFEEITQTLLSTMKDMIKNAILFNEPRINLIGVNIDAGQATQGLLLISIDYNIRTTNTRTNMVYPFYFNEATNGR